MDINGSQPLSGVPLPSIHLHPSLSSAARHQQTSTRISPHPAASSPGTAIISDDRESISRLQSSTIHSYRTTSRPSTASSHDDANSDDEDQWERQSHHSHSARHHPYRPQLSISPSASRRTSIYSPYSRSNDDMRAFLRASASASASANASADEGSNHSNSYYDGESSVAGMSPLTTSSPVFNFTPGGHNHAHHQHHQQQHPSHRNGGHGVTGGDRSPAGAGGGSQSSAAPLSLDSLPSYPPDQKPPFSYPVLIRLAILGSPQKRLLLSQIYSAIEEKFPWYRDSAPKAWKASVRHCLSLNKEFVRMQRAVEDPGVGCGGWWSVGEGMKGLKRPRKRRPAQSKRPDHRDELDPTPIIKAPTPSPLAIRRRHSSTFDIPTYAEPHPRYVSPLSSLSLPPSATSLEVDQHVHTSRSGGKDRRLDRTLPPIEDYSLRLPPLNLSNHALPLPTPPSSSRTIIFGSLGSRDLETGIKREYQQTRGYSDNASYGRMRGSHTPTASSSSSYSTQSYGSASSASSSSRPNPMSISSLLNDGAAAGVSSSSGMGDSRMDNMDVDIGELRVADDHDADADGDIPIPLRTSSLPKKADRDVDMRPKKVETPFSSDQTLRPPSPQSSSSPQSHGRRSTTPVAPTADQRRRTPHSQQRQQQPTDARSRPSSRPPSRSRATPVKPTRAPPPVPTAPVGHVSSLSKASGGNARKSTKKGGNAKGWASVMDLSKMDYESESE